METHCQEYAEVIRQEMIAPDIFALRLKTKEIAKNAHCGQFVLVYCSDSSRLLGRPISICRLDREEGTLLLVYRIAGEGTREISGLAAGDKVRIMGPLGNGFPTGRGAGKNVLLIAGGIGIPPMIQLAAELKAEGAAADMKFVLGWRDGQTFLKEDALRYADVVTATEDGSVGTRGNVLDAIRENDLKADVIYACGPTPMLRALKEYAKENGIECWLSLEERMACGIGACLACVCKSAKKDEHTKVNNKRICKEGPVFSSEDVIL